METIPAVPVDNSTPGVESSQAVPEAVTVLMQTPPALESRICARNRLGIARASRSGAHAAELHSTA